MEIIQIFVALFFFPVHVQGRTLTVNVGTSLSFGAIASNLIGFLAVASGAICLAVFMVGTLFVVISRGKEDQLQKGKDLMVGALIGLAVILGSYAIIRTFFYAIYTL